MINIDRIYNLAISVKPNNWDCKYPFHVTFISKKKKILSIGINKPTTTHTRNLNFNYLDSEGRNRSDLTGLHSEMAAIIRLSVYDCSKLTFYNIRLNKYNEIRLSKPCQGCLNLLNSVGYKNIYYTTNKGGFVKL